MENWKECQLGDILTFQRGHDLPKKQMIDGEYPVVGSNGIIGYHNEYTTEAPSITIGRSGNTGNPFIVYGKTWSHNTTLYIKEFKNSDPVYVYYLLRTLDLGNFAGGSAVPTLNRNHIHTLDISVPPLQEQVEIGRTLRALDDKIANNTKINNHLEQMAQAIFKSWFVDFEPFGGVMPDDWREGAIADTCSAIFNGGTPRRNELAFWDGTIPWLTSGEVRQAIIIKPDGCISEAGLKGSSAKWVPSLSTVVALYGATAGQVSIVATPLTTNQAITALVPKENCTYYNYLVMRNAVSQLENHAVGSAQQNISKAIVEKTACLIPADTVLAEFDKFIRPFFNDWIQNLFESSRLATLRDTLLPRLISGELSLSASEVNPK